MTILTAVLFLTPTGAEGRFRPCYPVLQNPQQFSDKLQNYTLHFTHTHTHRTNFFSIFLVDYRYTYLDINCK